ncbi:hypothetical protein [Agaribacterium sp. ZY112]|uniref:hypothetical protein n=1 Tax=Agaribacterium sp. ZY112 TaxID=3233574 RepID=UPI003524753F
MAFNILLSGDFFCCCDGFSIIFGNKIVVSYCFWKAFFVVLIDGMAMFFSGLIF